MRSYPRWLIAFSLLAFAGASAYANDTSKHKGATGASLDFNKADTNHDGKLSRQEFDAAVKSAGGAKSSAASGGSSASTTQRWDFAKADTNHDGSLSRQEFDAMTKGASAPRANSKSKY